VGGTCVIRGCVPKELLVYGSALPPSALASPQLRLDVGVSDLDAGAPCWPTSAPEWIGLNELHIGLLAKAVWNLVRGWVASTTPRPLR